MSATLLKRLSARLHNIQINLPSLRLLLLDLAVYPLVLLGSLVARFGADLSSDLILSYLPALPVFYLVRFFLYRQCGLYRRLWQYARVESFLRVSAAVVIGTVLLLGLSLWVLRPWGIVPGFSEAVLLSEGAFSLIAVTSTRFAWQLSWQNIHRRLSVYRPTSGARRVLIVGAGDAGVRLARDLNLLMRGRLTPIGFVDDAYDKQGLSVDGLPVLGNRYRLPELVSRYGVDEVLIAVPSASGKVLREIVEICGSIGVRSRTVPSLAEIVSGAVPLRQVRDVRIEDLLRREPGQVDLDEIGRHLCGRRVLVTGAGGSIGSELCRQVAACGPAELAMLDHAENGVFVAQQAILQRWPSLSTHLIIRDVREREKIADTFQMYRPEIVFHAAAHKHVPLMELYPDEAIANNVLGTHSVLWAALDCDAERFVLISTDKAVNPTSVMGATKRVAELLVMEAARCTGKACMVVRFGNVLGSAGSVVPLFQAQIAAGGPVTVSHPEVTRFFMTIPEAIQLVLQVAAWGVGGQVYVLDMGEPVRIVDLARDLIEFSGLELGKDIEIRYTGLRPGEKMTEELFRPTEKAVPTVHPQILQAVDQAPDVRIVVPLDELDAAMRTMNKERLLAWLARIVPEFQPDSRP
jgi:FlaA1/EpsC-like NDP-sugar epimerase